MRLKDWPAAERPREKLLARGVDALSDAELLAIILRNGARGGDAVTTARAALRRAGGLRPLLELDKQRFATLPSYGSSAYCAIQAGLELGRRYVYSTLEREGPLLNPAAATEFLVSRMKAYRREVFACLLLDARHRVIGFNELFFGSIDAATVHPREVVKCCLTYNAAAVILAHNHPSGVAEPSQSDRSITRRIVDAAQLVDATVLDHLIVGEIDTVSLAERGWL